MGLTYLAIGLFVCARQGSAQSAAFHHFALPRSFFALSLHRQATTSTSDLLGNVSGLLAPTVFLHFCLTFPEPRKWLRSRIGVAGIYVVAAAMIALFVGFASGMLRTSLSLLETRWLLDRIWIGALTAIYLLGAAALALEYRKAEDPIVRQQLKWLRNGAFYGILPFRFCTPFPTWSASFPRPR